jgi:DNA-binding XRE family transcriptional regulator
MSFQDWKPVVLTKMGSASSKSAAKVHPMVDPKAKLVRILDAYNAETPPPKVDKISAEEKKELIQLRLLKKITQDDLNRQLQLPKDTIKTIENGTHVKNKALFHKIKQFLSKP